MITTNQSSWAGPGVRWRRCCPHLRSGWAARRNRKQYLPWIHLQDLVKIIAVALVDDRYRGPVNGVSRTSGRGSSRVALHILEEALMFLPRRGRVRMMGGVMAGMTKPQAGPRVEFSHAGRR